MMYNFDETIDRRGTNSIKYDYRKRLFGKPDVIPFWVADMDFKTPDFIIQALRSRLDHELIGYTGIPESLRKVIVKWLSFYHQWDVAPEWITINPGVVPTLAFCVLAYTHPGDHIIVQPPIYFPFYYVIKNNGRKIIRNPLILQNGRYRMDFKDLKRKINSRTRMIMLCNPHNPGGSVWRKEELAELAEICKSYNILIVSDEIHSDLILFDHKHLPMASLDSDTAGRTITCLSSSKTFNTAGLALSYTVISNPDLRKVMSNRLSDFHLSYGNTAGLVALEASYRHGKTWLKEMLRYVEGNINWLENFLETELPMVNMIKPEGTYLAWLDFRELGYSQRDLKHFLVHDAGIGMSDGILFGSEGEGFQRMNLACPRSLIIQGMEQLKQALKREKKS